MSKVKSLYLYFIPLFFCSSFVSAKGSEEKSPLYHNLSIFVKTFRKDYSNISLDRKSKLKEIGMYVRECRRNGTLPVINFIDEGNDAQSQMLEAWAKSAIFHFGIEDIQVNSFGIKSKSITDLAIQSLEKAGFIAYKENNLNSSYFKIYFGYGKNGCSLKSKVIKSNYVKEINAISVFCDDEFNESYSALESNSKTLSQLPYVKPNNREAYMKLSSQMGLEMFYLFAHLKK